jgi:hypothetical protein
MLFAADGMNGLEATTSHAITLHTTVRYTIRGGARQYDGAFFRRVVYCCWRGAFNRSTITIIPPWELPHDIIMGNESSTRRTAEATKTPPFTRELPSWIRKVIDVVGYRREAGGSQSVSLERPAPWVLCGNLTRVNQKLLRLITIRSNSIQLFGFRR